MQTQKTYYSRHKAPNGDNTKKPNENMQGVAGGDL